MTHYETLGVSIAATQADITKAFRKLSMQHHPDREGGDKDAFQRIQAAYEILGDVEKRARYDSGAQTHVMDKATIIELSARQGMAQLFNEVLGKLNENNVDQIDFRAIMLDSIKQGRAMNMTAAQAAQSTIRKNRKVKSRMKAKDFMFAALIAENINTEKSKLKQAIMGVRVCIKMRALLDDFEYEFQSPQSNNAGFYFFSPTGSMNRGF